MYKHLALLLPLALVDCSALGAANKLQTAQVHNVPSKLVFQLRAGYDATFLPLAVAYKRHPKCPVGVHYTFSFPCKETKYVVQLQKADRSVEVALNNLQRVSESGDQITIGVAYVAAQSAITTAISIFDTYQLK